MPENDENADENPFKAIDGIKTVKLYKPITIDGKEVTELTLDFNKLTSADLDNIEAGLAAAGGAKHPVPSLSNAYNLRVAAKAAGINHNELKRLNAKDYTKLCLIAQNFLMD